LKEHVFKTLAPKTLSLSLSLSKPFCATSAKALTLASLPTTLGF
jgi:hypothetical protein